MIWLILVTVFISVLVLFLWFFRYLQFRRSIIKKRVVEIERREWHEDEDEGEEDLKRRDGESQATWLFWRVFGRIKLIRMLEARLQTELKRANILMKSRELITIMFLSGLLGGAIGVLMSGGSLLRGAWLGLFTWVIPLLWLNSKKNKRKKRLESQFPEMITMIANSLKAGYSLIQSLELLSREMAAPLSEEIQRMLQEMRLGVATEAALRNFNHRIDSKDLDLIITAMLIQRQVGGNLAEILDTIGNTIRERIKIQGELKSLTAQGRMSMIIFMLLPIGIAGFLMMSNPEYMMVLFTEPIGLAMIILAVFSQLIGAVIIKRIINIEV